MAIFRVQKLIVQAPPPGDLLPRWRYEAILQDTTTGDLQSVSFLSESENPESTLDVCNTIKDLAGIGNELDQPCA